MVSQQGKSVIIFNAGLLRKTSNNPASFIASQGAAEMEFKLKYLFARDNISTWRMGNKRPSLVVKEGLMLICHVILLVGVGKSKAICGGDKGNTRVNHREIEEIH